ncbi:MAG: ParB/RepB/Spo0J family partition protein [Candidatus Omnitrophica bacterium]|nr:ParB/RepB/Spo0J family partition protein [Candidatus Omnitrophota bacterium]
MERRVLGKGLDALIPKRPVQEESVDREFTYLPTARIRPGRFQPRRHMNREALEELAQSIKQNGVLQPIVVRQAGEGYEIVAGGRRFEAAKMLGLSEIPAVIRSASDKQTLVLAIIENLQRADLNPIEEAEAFKRLMDEFSFGLQQIAEFLGKDKTTVVNTLRLLKLPFEIKEAVKKGLVTRSQARTILGAENKEAQAKIFRQILSEGLTVREIEQRVRKSAPRSARQSQDPYVRKLEEQLQKLLGTKVRVSHRKNNTGRIQIEYYNLDDVDRIVRKLT